MSEKKSDKQGEASRAKRRRPRFAADNDGGRVSRPLLVALVVILAGGAYLFWPHGAVQPGGIGEQLTVVTADTTTTAAPRSGNVEIDDQQIPLVPEQPAASTQEPVAAKTVTKATPTAPAKTPARRIEPAAAPTIVPRPTGTWAVQVGAYQTKANAEGLVDRLAAKNLSANVRVANTSSGDLVYRVWIGWFGDRQEAHDYCRQEKDRIGEAYPVHR